MKNFTNFHLMTKLLSNLEYFTSLSYRSCFLKIFWELSICFYHQRPQVKVLSFFNQYNEAKTTGMLKMVFFYPLNEVYKLCFLSTMLAFNSFITLMPVAQYCEFCVLQLKLLNQINRMHFPNAVWARVTDELSDPVWTSLIFFRVWNCSSLSVLPVGKIIMCILWKEKSLAIPSPL